MAVQGQWIDQAIIRLDHRLDLSSLRLWAIGYIPFSLCFLDLYSSSSVHAI